MRYDLDDGWLQQKAKDLAYTGLQDQLRLPVKDSGAVTVSPVSGLMMLLVASLRILTL